jgi:hypothetical protein
MSTEIEEDYKHITHSPPKWTLNGPRSEDTTDGIKSHHLLVPENTGIQQWQLTSGLSIMI